MSDTDTNKVTSRYIPPDGVIGTRFKTNSYGFCEVIEYVSSRKVVVRFDSGYITTSEMGQLRRGDVKDKSLPNIRGIAYNDYPHPVKINNQHIPEYRLWRNMIERAYFSLTQAYKDVEICNDWLYFSKFKSDIESLPNFDKFISENWNLDKDILVKGGRLYSLENCCFVPQELNSSFVGLKNTTNLPLGVKYCKRTRKYVAQIMLNKKKKTLGYFTNPADAFYAYKTHKEAWLKDLAEKWKGVVDDKVYFAIKNYEVCIDD